MHRKTWMEIDLDAIEKNIRTAEEVSGKDVIAVVKADGYGLGDLAVARSAMDAGAKMLAVSSCDEAMILRNKGYKDQLLILGHTDTVDLPQLTIKQVAVPAYSMQWVKNAVEVGCKGLRVHIKVDTGMNRIGFKDSIRAEAAFAADGGVPRCEHVFLRHAAGIGGAVPTGGALHAEHGHLRGHFPADAASDNRYSSVFACSHIDNDLSAINGIFNIQFYTC